MPEYRLSILHVSDLHARSSDLDEVPEEFRDKRRREIRLETVSRKEVLGEEWRRNLREMYPDGTRPDVVCFTGDVADWGLNAEYKEAQKFFDQLREDLKIECNRIYVIPGNHDVHRPTSEDQWAKLRDIMPSETESVSRWLAGGDPPRDVEETVLDAVLQRTSRFWNWVERGLGRPELLPTNGGDHGRLGYCHRPDLGLPFPVFVIGLDSAWLAGQQNDRGLLWLTRHQRELLLRDEQGEKRPGFRLALMHHPLSELGDQAESRRDLAECVDLLLHGHQHDPVGSCEVDPDGRTARILAAGCLFEGGEGALWKNGCQRIDIVLDENGHPCKADIHFRCWSARGHWHSDSSLYKSQAQDGRLVWKAWGTGRQRSPAARTRSPQRPTSKADDADDASPADRVRAMFERTPNVFAYLAGSQPMVASPEQFVAALLEAESVLVFIMMFVHAMERAEHQSDRGAAEELIRMFQFAAPAVAGRCARLECEGNEYRSAHWSFPQSVELSAADMFDRNVAILPPDVGMEHCVPRYHVETESIPRAYIDQTNSLDLIDGDIALRSPAALEQLVLAMEKHLKSPFSGSLDERLREVNSTLEYGEDRVPRYTVIDDAEKPSARAFMDLLTERKVRLRQIIPAPARDNALKQQDSDVRRALTTLYDAYHRILLAHES